MQLHVLSMSEIKFSNIGINDLKCMDVKTFF
jgi:hypothetical protein